jgi:hypothetical protein
MTESHAPSGGEQAAGWCEIRIQGHLDPRRASWFDGLTLTQADGGVTVIEGQVVDQAALHGLLQKVRDIGLPLISVTHVDSDRKPF